MRYPFHLVLFIGALVIVTSAEAQPRGRADRNVTVVVAGHGHPKYHADKRIHRLPKERSYGHHKSRADYRLREEQRDLRQIVDISRAWKRATSTGDRYGQALTDRRLEVWVERELNEARRDHFDGRRIRELSRELHALNWRFANGRGRRHYYARKSEILDNLVALSKQQVRSARVNARPPMRLSLAKRY